MWCLLYARQVYPFLLFDSDKIIGWRETMEDTHIVKINITGGAEDIHLFGVFDGPGGNSYNIIGYYQDIMSIRS